MRVVTFNIHHGTVGTRGPVDPARLGTVCAGFDADVLALQEVDVGTWRARGADLAAEVARACGMEHVFGASRWFPGGRYGNALLVRGHIESWSVVPLPKVPAHQVLQERRTLLQARALVGDRRLVLAVTHLAVPQHVNGPQLDRALELVSRSTGGDAGRPDPVVVLGDLNRYRPTVEPAAQAAGLVYVPHRPTNPVESPHRTIDHVLISPDLRVDGVEVRPTEMSDHAALLVDLEPVDEADAEG